jgi:hypothetical protein
VSRRRFGAGIAVATLALLFATASVMAADPESGPPPSAAELAISDAKAQLAQDWLAVKKGTISHASFARKHPSYGGVDLQGVEYHAGTFSTSSTSLTALTGVTGIVWMYQNPQQNSYYCGPATGYEILKYLNGIGPSGETVTQGHLAAKCSPGYLCTNDMGQTPWYVGSSYADAGGHPMASTLNKWTDSAWYITVNGTTYDEAHYESYLIFDVDHGHPFAMDVKEVAGSGYHLPGHPTDRNIGHWVAAAGYNQSGDLTYYADSVYGVSTSVISWADDVPSAFSYFASTKSYSLFATRGYVW